MKTEKVTLTVGILRGALDLLPDDAVVVAHMPAGCCGEVEELEYQDMRTYSALDAGGQAMLIIDYAPVPGYESCIKLGSIKRLLADWGKK